MRLPIDPSGAVPLYRQMAEALRAAIAGGRLAPEQELPSVRDLAADNGVNYHTVARAYQELEEAGLLERRRGGPFRVVSGAQSDAGAQTIREGLDALARDALGLGIDPKEALGWWGDSLTRARQLTSKEQS